MVARPTPAALHLVRNGRSCKSAVCCPSATSRSCQSSDRRCPRTGAQRLLESLVRGLVEPLLPERLTAEHAQERGRVVLVLHPHGQLDHLVPPPGLGVELGERDGRVGVRLELLDDIDRASEVVMLLLRLGQRESDRIPSSPRSRRRTRSSASSVSPRSRERPSTASDGRTPPSAPRSETTPPTSEQIGRDDPRFTLRTTPTRRGGASALRARTGRRSTRRSNGHRWAQTPSTPRSPFSRRSTRRHETPHRKRRLAKSGRRESNPHHQLGRLGLYH